MFQDNKELFEVKENEEMFENICVKLKEHQFHSPWALCFSTDKECKAAIETHEIDIPIKNVVLQVSTIENEDNCSRDDESFQIQRNEDLIKERFLPLKTSLLAVQDTTLVEEIVSIDLLCSLTHSQLPQFCKFIQDAFLNETSLFVFLNSISNLKKPLSITITLALICQIIYPKILSLKFSNYRLLSSTIINFFMVYPKAVLDGILIPSLHNSSLDQPIQEILIKIVQNNLSEELIAHGIQSIINESVVTEKTFSILQSLVEKKIPYNGDLHDKMAFAVENWTKEYSSNIKFTKVLMSILSVFGPELSNNQLKIYSDAVRDNKTIMKKAAENILKKL